MPSAMQLDRTCDLVELALADGPTAPEWVRLFPLGVVRTSKGPFTADRADAERCIEAFKRLGRDLVIDYEHQTLADVEAPASGWVTELALRDDGLWAHVNWTRRAKGMIEAREYRYLSPVLLHRTAGGGRRPYELGPVALTNHPAIEGQPPLVNKDQPGRGPDEEVSMDWLKKLLGLGAEAKDDDVKAGVEGLVALKNRATELGKKLGVQSLDQVEALFGELGALRAYKTETLEALGLAATADASAAKGTLLALKNGAGTQATLAGELAALKANLAERDAVAAVDAALAEGKLTPAQKEWALGLAKKDPAAFAAYKAAAPVVVPPGRAAGQPPAATGEHGLTDTELQCCKSLGLTPEAYRKHNPVEA